MKRVASKWLGVIGRTVSLWALAVSAAPVWAEDAATALAYARSALEKGAGAVAAGALEAVLSGGTASEQDKGEARVVLAQILLRSGETARVESLLKGMEGAPAAALCLAQAALIAERWTVAAERFMSSVRLGENEEVCVQGRAVALSQCGRRGEAVSELRACLDAGGRGHLLVFSLASLLIDDSELDEARALLKRVESPSAAEVASKRFLEARIDLAEGRVAEAGEVFGALLAEDVPKGADVFVGALLGQAAVAEQRGEMERAARGLLQFLKTGRAVAGVEPLFQKLSTLLSETQLSVEEELRDCLRVGPPEQRALARFYLAQMHFNLGKGARGAAELALFCDEFPKHRLAPVALLQRAEQAMSGPEWAGAEGLISEGLSLSEEPAVCRLLQMRQALLAYRSGAFQKSLELFSAVAARWPELGAEAAYNAGLCALQLLNFRRAAEEVEVLKRFGGAEGLSAELELESALRRVSAGQPQADEMLQRFIRAHPSHPRLGDARVALAELCNREAATAPSAGARSSKVLRERAEALLRVVANDPQSPQSAVQARYLAVFLADAEVPRNEEEVLRMGEEFLRDFSGSPLVGEMRMKLGEIYFRRKDFANAEAHFATVAEQQTAGPLTETALFLAGQCASSLLNPGSVDRALGYWDKVASAGGALRWKARYQQAVVKSRLGEEEEGIVLFDLILKASAGVEEEMKLSARCGKADAMLSLAKRTGGSLDGAVSEYVSLAQSSAAPAVWRNQALYKAGKAREAAQPLEALKMFYSVLDAKDSAEAGEYFWLYKAGFDAARILEGQSAWRDAIALYERLAKIGGGRGEEAKNRATQLRLERFIWD